MEYKNSFKDYCESNHIRHPQTNGVIEIAHKEARKFIINNIANIDKEFNLLTVLVDANHVHNYNEHSVTKFRPVDLINNTSEDIYNEVITNIKKKYSKNNINIDIYKKGTKLRLKPGCYKFGKNIKFRKNKKK